VSHRAGTVAGSQEIWDRATAILADVLASAGVRYDADEGEAAFYGPKIDVQVADSAEREASIATIQVDFYQPERFDLEYVSADGTRRRPVLVHRSIIGSIERQVAHLLDTHGGAFPPWLAPVQLAVLPVSDGQLPDVRQLVMHATERGLRAEAASEGSLSARIRAHRLVPYQAVIGDAEAAAGEVSLRLRDGRRLPRMSAAEALTRIDRQVSARATELWDARDGTAPVPVASKQRR
jgi:threonyl-tRNA synthetase